MEIIAKAKDIAIGQPNHGVSATTSHTHHIWQGHRVVVIEMNSFWLPLELLDICTKSTKNSHDIIKGFLVSFLLYVSKYHRFRDFFLQSYSNYHLINLITKNQSKLSFFFIRKGHIILYDLYKTVKTNPRSSIIKFNFFFLIERKELYSY